MSNDNLKPRQERFCLEYILDFNATQAAKRAGYSERTAYSIGNENLRKPEIQKRIRELVAARNTRTLVAADRVLGKLAEMAFGNKAVTNRDRLRALDMLAKHVGIYDRQKYEYPEFLSETERLGRFLDSIPAKYKCVIAIGILLGPEEFEAISQALGEIERHYGSGGNNDEYTAADIQTPSDMIKFMKKILGAARIKRSIKGVLDGLLSKQETVPTRDGERGRVNVWLVKSAAGDLMVNGDGDANSCRKNPALPAVDIDTAPRNIKRTRTKHK